MLLKINMSPLQTVFFNRNNDLQILLIGVKLKECTF